MPATATPCGAAPIDFGHKASAPTQATTLGALKPLLAAGYGNPSSGPWASAPAVEAKDVRGRAAAEIDAIA
ncbi:MAG: hypothetical protein HKN63_01615 [Rhodobacteraceae bacterium]|nr:hypothetical protein [Paracoccaceae bacterium]